MLDNICELQ